MLCLLRKPHVGATVCVSVCMRSHMTVFSYLHMCMNTCSTCGRWEAKGTFSRLTRPKFDPPAAGWVFLSVCWGRRSKNPLAGWRVLQEDEAPAHRLGAKELTQHAGSASMVMLLTGLDNRDILVPKISQQEPALRWVSELWAVCHGVLIPTSLASRRWQGWHGGHSWRAEQGRVPVLLPPVLLPQLLQHLVGLGAGGPVGGGETRGWVWGTASPGLHSSSSTAAVGRSWWHQGANGPGHLPGGCHRLPALTSFIFHGWMWRSWPDPPDLSPVSCRSHILAKLLRLHLHDGAFQGCTCAVGKRWLATGAHGPGCILVTLTASSPFHTVCPHDWDLRWWRSEQKSLFSQQGGCTW